MSIWPFWPALAASSPSRVSFVATQGLAAPHHAKVVRGLKEGMPITDGIFPESKEFLLGYWIVDVETPERAYEIAGRISATPANGNTLNPALPESWIEIHADNNILIRVGKSDLGTGSVFTAYRQIAAEELSAPFEAITTVISGDTDRTPDGSGAFDFLQGGMPNIRKAATYVYQALLDLTSQKVGSSPRP